jgi:dihydrofolate synthase/folylpolyglutamate synthase
MKFPFWPNPSGYRDIDLGLSRVYDLLSRVGNPHLKLPPTIHIAGTNGKGSTLAFLRAIFSESGLKIHSYTSPHLVNFNERIILADEEISDDFLNKILSECKEAAEKFPKIPVTFFEGITVAAFLAFSRVRADLLLLEVGMGGRLDATNVLPEVLCSIITPISFDHEEFLGKTLAKIAFEKAGIIKKNCPVFVGKQKKSALRVIEERASQMGCEIGNYELGIGNYELVLTGSHQRENAALAVAVALTQKKFSITEKQIGDGLKKAFWPARLQKISSGKFFKILPKSCELYLDGSHNLQGAATVKEFLKEKMFFTSEILKQVQDDGLTQDDGHAQDDGFTQDDGHAQDDGFARDDRPARDDGLARDDRLANPKPTRPKPARHPELVSGSKPKKIFVIFSMLKDKNCEDFLKKISKEVDQLIALAIPNETKSRTADEINKIAKKIGINSVAAKNFDEAFRMIEGCDEEAVVLVCGSLYLAGNFLEANFTSHSLSC